MERDEATKVWLRDWAERYFAAKAIREINTVLREASRGRIGWVGSFLVVGTAVLCIEIIDPSGVEGFLVALGLFYGSALLWSLLYLTVRCFKSRARVLRIFRVKEEAQKVVETLPALTGEELFIFYRLTNLMRAGFCRGEIFEEEVREALNSKNLSHWSLVNEFALDLGFVRK